MSAAPSAPGPAPSDGAPTAEAPSSAPVAGSDHSPPQPPPPAAYARTVEELAAAGIVEVPRASLRSVAAAAGKRGWRVRGIDFEVDARYSLLRVLGTGSYGVVVAAWDAVTGVVVAIKRVAHIFDDVVEARRILREIRLMRSMHHDALLGLIDVDVPALDAWDAWHNVYLVSLQMDRDLHRVLRSPVPLTDAHCRFFAWQLLTGVKYMHSANVLHRDLKPANLLVNEDCSLRICDFGLARYVGEGSVDVQGAASPLTQYVSTRWFRAPELVLCRDAYSTAVDMWSVGAILADLLGRRPLFPGRDFRHQISTIVSVLGTPAEDEIAHVTSPTARAFLASLPATAPIPLRNLLPGAPEDALDLLSRLLCFNPAIRLSATEALEHPYVASFHEPALEGVAGDDVLAGGPLEPPAGDLPPSVLRGLMWREVLAFHPNAVGVVVAAGGPGGAKREAQWAGESESPRSSMPV